MLQTKQVGEYLVSQMGVLEGARMRLYQRNIAAEVLEPDEAMVEALDEWALVAACTTPFIPRNEYFAMPINETRPLVEAVEELNASLAPETEAVKKK
jgi:hypothetical protein